MIRALLALIVLIAACGGGQAARSSSAPSAAATPTAVPRIDVSDMMGGFPPATFFVVRTTNVTALALLNHATKYTIPIEPGGAQVATAGEAGRVYVLDQTREGARIRLFDIVSGAERASRTVPGAKLVPTGTGHGTLAVDRSTWKLFALLRVGAVMALEEFDPSTLQPLTRRLADTRCGDRIAAAGGRLALACLSEGLLVVQDQREFKLSAGMPLVGMAMLANGTLMAGAADGRLVRLEPAATELERIDTLRARGSRVLTDGIAAQGEFGFVVGLVELVSNPQIRIVSGGPTLVLFPESAPPSGGILVQPPFAYYAVGMEARHIDLEQGFAEVMAGLGEVVVPGAVADR